MTIVRKTIALTEQQNAWINAQILSGLYTNDSEYLRDMIRRDQERQRELSDLRLALIAGEQSGPTKALDVQAFKKKMHVRVKVSAEK